jgi:lipoate-protein ligase B
LVTRERLKERGIDLHGSQRGGDITAHAPGQWVLYPILKLKASEMGTHGYLHALEEIAISTAQRFGIPAFRREGMAGGWTDQGKFAAIGFKFTRWVSWHGMSLNVCPDLSLFDLIVGCGLSGENVTSFERVLGAGCPGMDEVAYILRERVEAVLQREMICVPQDQL